MEQVGKVEKKSQVTKRVATDGKVDKMVVKPVMLLSRDVFVLFGADRWTGSTKGTL